LPEQESGFVRVIGRPRFHPRSIPGARWSVKPAGNFTTAVEHDLLDGFVVDGMGRRLTHLLIGERPCVQIEENERRGQYWDLPSLELAGVFRGKIFRIVVGYGVDQIDLTSP